jgi:HEPN domain-containing protein
MKAVLLQLGIPFPYTHSLQALLEILPSQVIIPELYGAVDLTPYAVSSRYPRMIEPVTEDDYHNAMAIAEAVVAWAEAIINKS